MKKSIFKHIILGVIVISVTLLTIRILNFPHSSTKPPVGTGQQVMQKLPEDVENVLEGYDYSNNADDIKLEVSGKKIIRRGRRILGLRSNIAKTNFFEDIRGTLRTKTANLRFSAADAEWTAIRSQPFILKKDVSLILNGKSLHEVKSAKIYFDQGMLEVNNGNKVIYRLK